MKGEAVRVFWPARAQELLYGKDAAKGAVLACLKDRLQHGLFHIGSGQTATGEEVVGVIKKQFPSANITLVRGEQMMPYPGLINRQDFSRARSDLGYEPEYLLEKGLVDYVETIKKIEGL